MNEEDAREEGVVSMAGERAKMCWLRSRCRTRRERQMGFVVSQGDVAAINDEVRKHQSDWVLTEAK